MSGAAAIACGTILPGRTCTLTPGITSCVPLMITAVRGGEAGAHDAQAVDQRPERDRPRRDVAVLADDQHDLARLIGLHGGIRARAAQAPPAGRQAHVAEHAGRQELARIGDDRAQPDRSGPRVEAVVGEIEPSVPAIVGLVLQPDFDVGRRGAAFARPPRLEEQALRTRRS